MARADAKKNRTGASAFVLIVGDEGAVLVQMQKKQVVRRLFAQSPDPNHSRAMDEALSASPKASITILVDMMDQSYVRQTLPPVSSFSVGKIVRRRLDKDFSPDDITGYMILDREKTGRKDWNYLMVSLANPLLLQKWITFAVERPNPFKGLGVVPLEAQPFLLAAEKAILLKEKGKDAKPYNWQILVNHHKVGGFRQIVLHKGKLIFTRMAQPIGESLPAVIAGNIEQEITNTTEYLKRLGLEGPESVSVIIIASEDIKKVLDLKNIKAGSYHFFTPYEITTLLSIGDAAQPEDQFGDVAIAAFIGKKNKLLLPLNTPYTRKLLSLSRIIMGTKTATVLATLTIFAWAGVNGSEILTTKQDREQLASSQTALRAQVNATKQKAQILPKNINMFTDVETLVKLFDKRRLDPLVVVNTLAGTLQNTALLGGYHWVMNNTLATGKEAEKRQMEAEINVNLTTPAEPHNLFIDSATALIERIKTAFPDFDVSHSALPGMLAESQDLKTVIDDTTTLSPPPAETIKTNTAITITIKGPLQKTTATHH